MKLFQLFESKELVSELLWFQRYINDHDLETQLEIENNEIIFLVGDKIIGWDVEDAKRIRKHVLTDAIQSYKYAMTIKCRFELGEPVIANDYKLSYYYAKNIIKGRFELGELAIIKNAGISYMYARNVIKKRFKLGELAISKDEKYASKYHAEFML